MGTTRKIPVVIKVCARCGEEFMAAPRRANAVRYCPACAAAASLEARVRRYARLKLQRWKGG
ncbi:hypothetical protein [Desulfovirgula thermocuniculi]|uniref:hypothetical protein n=1 Tax=Desulfovirgula thermocuniculi TaxID=348842 RepID=UPI000405AC38|nr:hypothetical protein [Desulfovirgula thermocuniculi]